MICGKEKKGVYAVFMHKFLSSLVCLLMLAQFSVCYGQAEKEIGTWTVIPNSVLVIKEINGLKWLLQTTPERSYYVIRGKNFLSGRHLELTRPVDQNELANEVTGEGGMLPAKKGKLPAKWQARWWKAQGFTQNEEGEFVKVSDSSDSATPPAALENLGEGEEIRIAQWSVVPSSFVVIKKIEGKLWLLQTTPGNTYYVVRGKNHLDDRNVKLDAGFAKSAIQKMLANEVTGIGGLMPAVSGSYPANFPAQWFHDRGIAQNEKGEWVAGGEEAAAPEDDGEVADETAVTSDGQTDKPAVESNPEKKLENTGTKTEENSSPIENGRIKVPVGVISWDAWYHDYWNERPEGIPDNRWEDMKRINVTSSERYYLSYLKEHKNIHLVPFWGKQDLSPEMIDIYAWNSEKKNYDVWQKPVTVAFDKDQAACDKEIEYMANAGIDFVLFVSYRDDSPLSQARRLFVASKNKRGVKMSLIIGSFREPEYIDYLADLMTKDYWLKIDGRPAVFFWPDDTQGSTNQLQDLRTAYAAKSGGGKIYVSTIKEGTYLSDDLLAKTRNENIDAISAYSVGTDGTTHAESIMKAEVGGREEVINRVPDKDIIVNITLGIERYRFRTDLSNSQGDHIRKEKASLAEIDEKFNSLAQFIDANQERAKAVVIYSWNEISESGITVCPTLNKDGSINTDVIDRISPWIK